MFVKQVAGYFGHSGQLGPSCRSRILEHQSRCCPRWSIVRPGNWQLRLPNAHGKSWLFQHAHARLRQYDVRLRLFKKSPSMPTRWPSCSPYYWGFCSIRGAYC